MENSSKYQTGLLFTMMVRAFLLEIDYIYESNLIRETSLKYLRAYCLITEKKTHLVKC